MMQRRLIPFLLLFLLLFVPLPVKATGHYRYITVYNPNSYDLTDYQVRIDLTSYTLTDSTGTDVRFYDENGNLLPFYRESWAGSQAGQTKVFWVKMSIPASSSKRIKITYATGAADASQLIWDFYDDFSSFTNGTRWYLRFYGSGTYTAQAESGWLHLYASVSDTLCGVFVESIQKFTNGFEVVYADKMSTSDWWDVVEIATKTGLEYPWTPTYNGYYFAHKAGTTTDYYYSVEEYGTNGQVYIAHSAGSFSLDTVYLNKIDYYRNGTIVWTVGSTVLKGSNTVYLNDQKSIVLGQMDHYSYDGGNRYIDYIYVRKLADKEPTYTVTVEDIQQLATPTLVSPSGYVNTTSVLLQWNSVPNANSYWVQISEYSDFSALTANTTTVNTYLTFGAAEKTYYWRVKALGSSNFLDSNWSSSLSFTVDVTHPLVSLLAPANGTIKTTASVDLQWSSTDNRGISSQVLFITFPNGTTKQISLSASIASYTVTSDDGRLYWQVKAVDVAGNSYLSEKRVFFVDTRLPYAPVLDSPANNSWIQSDRVIIQWHDTDYDVMQTVLYVEQVGGTYSYSKTVNSGNGSVELAFTQEGTYKWHVKAVDWANNQQSSSSFVFNVILGSVVPLNLTANATGFSFDLQNKNGAQTVSYQVIVFNQNGAESFSTSGSAILSANEKRKITGLFPSLLSAGIYRLRVIATDEKGASKSNETWFLVTGTAERDWSNWACNYNVLFQNVNFTRFYFEYGSAESQHQVQLQFPNALSCTVFENTTKQKISCFPSSSYISFTALARDENQPRAYFISVLAQPLLTSETKQKDVIFQGIKCAEYLLRIKNQYSYDILKLRINSSKWIYVSLNETALKPLQEINVTYYVPYSANASVQNVTSSVLSVFKGDWLIYVLLLAILGMVILWRRR
jgi:hypothetical protein